MKKRKYKRQQRCTSVLKTDNVNTFNHVVASLQEICGHNYFQAVQCAHLVHHKGYCEIFKDVCSLTESIYEELKEVGLVVEITK